MIRYSWLLSTVALLLATIIGCSNGSGSSPILPPNGPGDVPGLTGESVVPDAGTGGHLLSGYWHILINTEEGDLDVIPLRGTSMHLNLAGILSQNPVWLSVQVNDINIPGRLLDFDITITHPVPNSDIRVFDMRGILMGLGNTLSASSDAGLVYTGPDGIRLLNSDGYTRWWNAVEFTTPGIFGYDNDFIVPDFIIPTTTLNPYKYFADALDPTDEVIPGVNDTNRGTFSTTGNPPSVTRNYMVRFPLEADKPKLGFHFAIDLSFAPATGGNPTPKPIGDFPLAANMPEAFYIDVNMDNSWVWYMDDENRGGNLVLDIEVFDWGAMENPDGINGEIESITLESQTLFPDPVTLQSGPVLGSQSTSGVFYITIPDCTPTDVMDQEILVTVKSSYPATYAPPVPGPDWPQNAHLAAYTLVEVPILIAEPSFVSITVKSPNGGEVWPITSQQEILWFWTDEVPMVDIDLSLDGGQTYDINLADDIENTGSFVVETVGDWSSESAKIRVSSSSEPEVNDVSDENFLIEPDIHLIAPNGGEYWIEGNAYQLTWAASSSVENVMILLSNDSGSNYMDAITMATPNDGSYLWYIDPSVTEGNHCRIKVLDVLPTLIEDESDGDFTIFPEELAPLNVVSPNGGEVWTAGTAREITWNAVPTIENVTIDLSLDGGQTWPINIVESTPNTSSFIWDPVPDEAIGDFNRVRITATGNPIIYDISNDNFIVQPEGDIYILIQDPMDGQLWQIGCNETVEWQWGGDILSVNIQLNLDNLGSFSTIVSDLSNNGAYEIFSFIPENIDNLSLWDATELTGQIRVESFDDPGIFDDAEIVIPINLGILYDMVQASDAGDGDGDEIPDDVEVFLGTNPNSNDSDQPDPDAFFDNFEIFGQGYFDSFDLIPDIDGDGIIAPLDPDDDGDGINDGEQTDSDLDSVPNYLEYYGYTYEWMTGTYDLWDGISIDERYYKTDPLQPSTDQDPFSDGMEASGLYMDVSVEEPGDNPMVPAYPNIVVRLEGYQVTVNEQITIGEGNTISQGTSWSAQTTKSHSYQFQHGWEVSAGVDFGYASTSAVAVFHVSASYGQTYTTTNSNSVTRSEGGSYTSADQWSRATCINPTDAAHIKLYLKVYNEGTSCASNIIPTLTLKLGGFNVATFEQANSQINILEPGGVYPSAPGTFWVIDSIDTGVGAAPLSLTLDELRALECGAPVSVVMTQMSADVMLMNESGQWESAGDWGEYMARCESVCSNMFVEIGGGNFLHYLIYSDDAVSAPEVTFGDALAWAAGAGTDQDDIWITYIDHDGMEQTASLDDWDFNFDAQTLLNNGFTVSPLAPPTPDYNLKDLVLFPDTQIIGKIPRERLDDVEGPEVIYAYLDEKLDVVKVLAIDYNGISDVYFYDKDGFEYQMYEKLQGTGIFTLPIAGTYVSHVTDGNGMQEKVIVYSSDSSALPTEEIIERVEYDVPPSPVPPTFDYVQLNAAEHTLTVDISFHPDYPLSSVQAAHPPEEWGPVSMVKNPFWWIWPNRYEIGLPDEINQLNDTDTVIIAYALGCEPLIHHVTENEVVQGFSGDCESVAWHGAGQTNCAWPLGREKFGTVSLNLDQDDGQPVQLMRDTGCYFVWPGWHYSWDSYHWGNYDLWVRYYYGNREGQRYGGSQGWLIFFNNDYCLYDGPKDFYEITKQDCEACTLTPIPPFPIAPNLASPTWLKYDHGTLYDPDGDTIALPSMPAIFIMKTGAGDWAKIKLENLDTFLDPTSPFSPYLNYGIELDFEYVVFP